MLQSQDMSNEEHRKRVLDMLGEGVFKNLAMRANVEGNPDEGSCSADFIEELKELSSLHFKSSPTPAAAPPTPAAQTKAAAAPPETIPATTEPEAEPSA